MVCTLKGMCLSTSTVFYTALFMGEDTSTAAIEGSVNCLINAKRKRRKNF